MFPNLRSRVAWSTVVIAVLLGACGSVPTVSETTRHALAPTGALRVGVYSGSPSSIVGTPGPDARGVGYDLGQAMAQRLGVPFEPVVFSNNGLVIAAVRKGEVDVVFTNATPDRARDIDFSPTFLDVGKSFLVPPASSSGALADMQRAGLKVGVSAGSSTAVELAPLYPAATITPVPTLKDGIEMLRTGQLDAFATNSAILFEMSDSLPGSHVLAGNWGLEHFAAGIPKGRESGDAFMAAFIRDAVRDGTVGRAVQRAGLRGTVAPGTAVEH